MVCIKFAFITVTHTVYETVADCALFSHFRLKKKRWQIYYEITPDQVTSRLCLFATGHDINVKNQIILSAAAALK